MLTTFVVNTQSDYVRCHGLHFPKAVSLGKLHGYGVLLRIEQISGGALEIQQGALNPALSGWSTRG